MLLEGRICDTSTAETGCVEGGGKGLGELQMVVVNTQA